MLALTNRFKHKLLGESVAADELDHDIDLRILCQGHCIGSEPSRSLCKRLGFCRVEIGHRSNRDAAASTAAYFLCISSQHRPGAATHGAQAGQSNA